MKIISMMILTALLMAGLAKVPVGMIGIGIGNVYADDNWYVGNGVKQNMHVTYKIQNHDTNQGQPFTMTIYFKNHNDTGHYWVAPVFVNDQGEIINGTFNLSDLDLTALGSSKIPPALLPYKNAYASSLEWLAAFVAKPGQSLTAQYWGKIAAIGGSPIAPSGTQTITVSAGTFPTTIIKWHKGVDNVIWINKDFPYPIKAQTYADTTTGNPPIQYAFELLATGQGQPPIPKSVIEIPKSPIMLQTARGTYYIELFFPPAITTGNETKFGILFRDNAQNPISEVSYSFKITDKNGTAIVDLHDQKAPDGTSIQKVKFEKPGPITVTVFINAVGGSPMGDFVESSDFKLAVSEAGQNAASTFASTASNTTSTASNTTSTASTSNQTSTQNSTQ
jgi:hypothetical protein